MVLCILIDDPLNSGYSLSFVSLIIFIPASVCIFSNCSPDTSSTPTCLQSLFAHLVLYSWRVHRIPLCDESIQFVPGASWMVLILNTTSSSVFTLLPFLHFPITREIPWILTVSSLLLSLIFIFAPRRITGKSHFSRQWNILFLSIHDLWCCKFSILLFRILTSMINVCYIMCSDIVYSYRLQYIHESLFRYASLFISTCLRIYPKLPQSNCVLEFSLILDYVFLAFLVPIMDPLFEVEYSYKFRIQTESQFLLVCSIFYLVLISTDQSKRVYKWIPIVISYVLINCLIS